jgi:ATP phosphoribosyltransferase regulatory subunit
VRLQLDPSFQPHFDLYDGLVLKLVCRGVEAPLAIASGGRYDALVGRFGGLKAGLGFSFDVEVLRELLGTDTTAPERPAATLVAFAAPAQLAAALQALEALHAAGQRAELLPELCASAAEAEAIASARGCSTARWIGPAA